MDMDISHILADWPHKPGQVTARRIRGRDGQERIQLRLDMGILQMEASGRPDGQLPHGHESLLAYHEYRLQRYRQDHEDRDEGFDLDEADCELLRAEGVMYYHRYLAEFVLGEYEAVERDTMRNLRLTDFCRRYAREDSDRYVLEQYRAYVIMMCTRARAHVTMDASRPKAALAAVRKGIRQIEEFLEEFGVRGQAEQSGELAVLRALEKEVESQVPVDPVQRLREHLAEAVEAEQYERAAELRDQLRCLTGED